ncbi:MAG: hypothetical protein KOO69_06250 [Victivallales bacterium]|nr:hypothetical protein [Victivallales bacterium]
MKKLTSKMTFFNKRVFPCMWFGFLVFFVIGVFTSAFSSNNTDKPGILFLFVPVFMAVFGYFIMKKLVFDLIDEVYDEGSNLLFKNAKKQVRVNLNDIKNVSYTSMGNPPRVTISLREETILGKELTFSPPGSFTPFTKNKDIEDLIDRIDKAKNSKQ